MAHDKGIDGAETKAAFAERIYAAMDDVLARPAEWQVVITHGFALAFVVAAWIGMPVGSLGYVNFRVEPGQHHDVARGRLLLQPRGGFPREYSPP